MIKKSMMILLSVGSILIVIWSLWSWLSVRSLEKPTYEVLSKNDIYEVRKYEPYIIAQTTVSSAGQQGLNDGFRIIANYIFGSNKTSESIKMTTPVLEEKKSQSSEKISMTTPVLEEQKGREKVVSFVMPSKYTLETLPQPLSDKVELREVPARTIAVRTYRFYSNADRLAENKKQLRQALENDGEEIIGEMMAAYYNPPLSMPLFIHNEVMIEIQ